MNKNSCVASFLVVTLVVLLVAPAYVQGIAPSPDLWRSFAEKIEPGKTVKVRLMTGQRFKATLLQVSTDGMIVQPKTRAPVPPQVVPFDQVASLEIDTSKGRESGQGDRRWGCGRGRHVFRLDVAHVRGHRRLNKFVRWVRISFLRRVRLGDVEWPTAQSPSRMATASDPRS
jgi:hypothetical protein